MTWRCDGANGFRKSIRQLRKPRINEQGRRVIVKGTVQKHFLKPLPPLSGAGTMSKKRLKWIRAKGRPTEK
jgi:hypothetical protein